MTRRHRGVVVVAALLFITPVAFAACSDSNDSKEGRGRPPALVEVAAITNERFADTFHFVGRVEAQSQAIISAEVEGTIQSFPTLEGAPVTKGGPLLVIDDTEYRLKLTEAQGWLTIAETAAEKAKIIMKRNEKLHAEGAVSNEALITSQLNYQGASAEVALKKAERDRAKNSLADCRPSSPFDGVLATRYVDAGERVSPGDRLFEVVDMDHLEIVGTVPDHAVASVTTGLAATVTIDGVHSDPFPGTVIALSPKANTGSATFLIRVAVTNRDGAIKGGMTGRVQLSLGEVRSAPHTPRDALIKKGQKSVVYVIDPTGKAVTEKEISLGRQSGELIEIISGDLHVGDQVVVTGAETLRDGASVTIVNGPTPATPPTEVIDAQITLSGSPPVRSGKE